MYMAQRYCHFKTNACATTCLWEFERLCVGNGRAFRNVFQTRHQRYCTEMEESLPAIVGTCLPTRPVYASAEPHARVQD
jgi:hypothetical protein